MRRKTYNKRKIGGRKSDRLLRWEVGEEKIYRPTFTLRDLIKVQKNLTEPLPNPEDYGMVVKEGKRLQSEKRKLLRFILIEVAREIMDMVVKEKRLVELPGILGAVVGVFSRYQYPKLFLEVMIVMRKTNRRLRTRLWHLQRIGRVVGIIAGGEYRKVLEKNRRNGHEYHRLRDYEGVF